MKGASIGKNRRADSFELKMGSCPVNGMNSYSGFKNGVLVFMMDEDRASVFRAEDVGGDLLVLRIWRSGFVLVGIGRLLWVE